MIRIFKKMCMLFSLKMYQFKLREYIYILEEGLSFLSSLRWLRSFFSLILALKNPYLYIIFTSALKIIAPITIGNTVE